MLREILMILAFIGDWLLFAYPWYQAHLELSESQRFLNSVRKVATETTKVSPWFWLIPFLKIALERRRAQNILKGTVKNWDNFQEMMSFLNKATAWMYVAVGGLLNAWYTTYELLDHMHVEPLMPWWIASVVILMLVSDLMVDYRGSEARQRHFKERYFKN